MCDHFILNFNTHVRLKSTSMGAAQQNQPSEPAHDADPAGPRLPAGQWMEIISTGLSVHDLRTFKMVGALTYIFQTQSLQLTSAQYVSVEPQIR